MVRIAVLFAFTLGTVGAAPNRTPGAAPSRPAVPADTGLMAKATVKPGVISTDPDGTAVTTAMIDAGRGVFHGQGGCFACHGTEMQGSAVAPPLNKQGKPWVVATGGTYHAILNIVTHGVPGTLMISHPNGISDALAADVAAYIWAVNHNGAKP